MKKLTKKEASEILGTSTRAIERYTAKGLLHVTYDDDRRALYDEREVSALKLKMEEPRQPATTAIARRGEEVAIIAQSIGQQVGLQIAQAMSQPGAAAAPARDLRQLAIKLVLTVDEAVALSGLGKSHIIEAIQEGKLKRLPGRARRIKRVDLEMYVKKL
ncbi:MAG TPA: helix-turn-helix domain-containing protein [Blastocatellia bacterium]|jgi:excisionase family DNA binding protein